MKIRRGKKSGFLETCASSDMAFLLIIYFMVIAGFNINKGFLMNLPMKDSTRLILREDLLRFDMDGGGNIIHDEETITITQAGNIIRASQNINPNIAVIITIDGNARWQNVVSFVELAQDLSIDSFSFTMRASADASGVF
jgi:biopolymer transport protein ExbD